MSPLSTFIEGEELAALEPLTFSECESVEAEADDYDKDWHPTPGPERTFDRIHDSLKQLQSRSRCPFSVAEYAADCAIAAKAVLGPKLLLIYNAWTAGRLDGVPAHVLARNADILEIKRLVGCELTRRGISNVTGYFARPMRAAHFPFRQLLNNTAL